MSLPRTSIECKQKRSMEPSENLKVLAKFEGSDKESKSIDVQKLIANDIDEGAWYVCNKVWNLLESPVSESNELHLNERLADIQVFYFAFFIISELIFLIF